MKAVVLLARASARRTRATPQVPRARRADPRARRLRCAGARSRRRPTRPTERGSPDLRHRRRVAAGASSSDSARGRVSDHALAVGLRLPGLGNGRSVPVGAPDPPTPASRGWLRDIVGRRPAEDVRVVAIDEAARAARGARSSLARSTRGSTRCAQRLRSTIAPPDAVIVVKWDDCALISTSSW